MFLRFSDGDFGFFNLFCNRSMCVAVTQMHFKPIKTVTFNLHKSKTTTQKKNETTNAFIGILKSFFSIGSWAENPSKQHKFWFYQITFAFCACSFLFCRIHSNLWLSNANAFAAITVVTITLLMLLFSYKIHSFASTKPTFLFEFIRE